MLVESCSRRDYFSHAHRLKKVIIFNRSQFTILLNRDEFFERLTHNPLRCRGVTLAQDRLSLRRELIRDGCTAGKGRPMELVKFGTVWSRYQSDTRLNFKRGRSVVRTSLGPS